jgi:hypothetical protein
MPEVVGPATDFVPAPAEPAGVVTPYFVVVPYWKL